MAAKNVELKQDVISKQMSRRLWSGRERGMLVIALSECTQRSYIINNTEIPHMYSDHSYNETATTILLHTDMKQSCKPKRWAAWYRHKKMHVASRRSH